MHKEAELAQLEQFVDKLLNRYNELKQNYQSLQATLQKTEEERDDLNRQLETMRAERSEVKSRVSGLIGRIEEWENEQGGFSTEPQEVSENESAQGKLFAMDKG